MKRFIHTKEHKEALANTRRMASSVKFYKAVMDRKPSWREAKKLIHEKGTGYNIQ